MKKVTKKSVEAKTPVAQEHTAEVDDDPLDSLPPAPAPAPEEGQAVVLVSPSATAEIAPQEKEATTNLLPLYVLLAVLVIISLLGTFRIMPGFLSLIEWVLEMVGRIVLWFAIEPGRAYPVPIGGCMGISFVSGIWVMLFLANLKRKKTAPKPAQKPSTEPLEE
ncbi:MAG: hypothetical protein AAB443_02815 [Patescibacteria group bacterium]